MINKLRKSFVYYLLVATVSITCDEAEASDFILGDISSYYEEEESYGSYSYVDFELLGPGENQRRVIEVGDDKYGITLQYCDLASFIALENLINQTVGEIVNREIESGRENPDFDPAPTLHDAKFLDLEGNLFTSFAGAPENMLMDTLDFSKNRLISLNGLPETMLELESFHLSNNFLTNLIGFPRNTPKLSELDLSNNQLIHLRGLPSFIPSLNGLDLSNNRLTSLEGLPRSQERLLLNVSNNYLTSVENAFREGDNIGVLDLSGNPLRNLRGLENLRDLSFLTLNNSQYITETMVRELKGRLPRCIIIFNGDEVE